VSAVNLKQISLDQIKIASTVSRNESSKIRTQETSQEGRDQLIHPKMVLGRIGDCRVPSFYVEWVKAEIRDTNLRLV
jgi:hypothetical protein